MKTLDRVTNLEDMRRVFVLTMKIIAANDKEDNHTFVVSDDALRIELKPTYGEGSVIVPTKYYNQAVKRALELLGLPPEDAQAYRFAFGELEWVVRGMNKKGHYKPSLLTNRDFYGKRTSVMKIDNIKLSFLMELEGDIESHLPPDWAEM